MRSTCLAILALSLTGCAATADGDMDEMALASSAPQVNATVVSEGLVLRSTVPATCGEDCLDADGDGLSDLWEDAVLERLRPRLVLDLDEPVYRDPEGRFGLIGRVFRPAGAPTNIVRAIIITGFAFDEGVSLFGAHVSGHDGDSERVAVELELRDDGRESVLRQAFFSAHENMPNDHSRIVGPSEIARALRWGHDPDGQPRWLVFSSKAKHALFPDPDSCHAASLWSTSFYRESCGTGEADAPVVGPPIVNAGERGRHRVDDLAIVNFPGERAWDESSFCGGLRASGHSRHLFCAGGVGKKLLADPFAS